MYVFARVSVCLCCDVYDNDKVEAMAAVGTALPPRQHKATHLINGRRMVMTVRTNMVACTTYSALRFFLYFRSKLKYTLRSQLSDGLVCTAAHECPGVQEWRGEQGTKHKPAQRLKREV